MEIEVVIGDIVEESVDAIVTAANESLTGGGGVDWAVHSAAGPELARAGAKVGPCDPGNAIATESFALAPRVRWIIHAVGPVWEGGSYGEPEILASTYRRVMAVADELGVRTLSIPAISTGIYDYPPKAAARVALRTLRTLRSNVEHVRLVAFDDENYEALIAALEQDPDDD